MVYQSNEDRNDGSCTSGKLMFDSAFLRDPYPSYRALRASGRIHWSEQFCGGAWLLTHYSDVAQVLRDPRFSAQRAGGWVNRSGPEARGELREFKRLFARSLLFRNGLSHARLRQVMNAAFRPSALRAVTMRIQSLVDALLQGIERDGTTDFIHEFARPLPAMVIAEMLGIDAGSRSEFVAWSDDIAAFIDSPTPSLEIAHRAQTALVAMSAYFEDVLAQRRGTSGDDLLSLLLRAKEAGQIKTHKELLAQCCSLLFAGHETTRNLLGNGLLALLDHPEQWRLLKERPALMPSSVRELLRFDSPVQYTGRRVLTDVELHGQRLQRGDLVILLLAAANRDPAQFSAPDVLDITRDEGKHLSFGYGPHVCLGATLTYLEAEIAFGSLTQRLPDLQLNGATLQWNGNAVYRGLVALPVRRAQKVSAQRCPGETAVHDSVLNCLIE